MQQRQKQIGHAGPQDLKVDPPLWEVICSTILANPAERSVVQQVIGETLIQESAFLHREAVALHNILSSVKGNQGAHETQGNARKQSPHSLIEEHNSAVCANPRPHPHHNFHRKNGCQWTPYANTSEKTDKKQLQSRTSVVGFNRLLKTGGGDANVPFHQNKATKDHDGTSRLDKVRKSVMYGGGTRMVCTQQDALSPSQRLILSSSPSSLSDKTESAVNRSSSLPDHIVDNCPKDILSLDFKAFLHEKGEKINAYDIDEVVHELHDAFANEQVYLNQLVERLRGALEECIDSYPMACNKSKVIKDQVKVSNRAELSKSESRMVTKTSKDVGQVSQKPPFSDSSPVNKASKDVGQVKVSNRAVLSKSESCLVMRTSNDVGQVSQKPPFSDSPLMIRTSRDVGQVKIFNRAELSKSELFMVTRTSKDIGQVSQRPSSPLSKPSLVSIVKNTKLEKSASKPPMVQLSKTTVKPAERTPLKHVVITTKSSKLT